MNDSGFLSDLARTARKEEAEERRRWDRWDRLTDGTVSPEEQAGLRADDGAAFEAFRPLGPEFNARMAEMFGRMVTEGTPPIPDPAPNPMPNPVEKRELNSASDEQGRRRRSRSPGRFVWRAGFAGSGLAAAAMLFLVFRPLIQGPDLPVPLSFEITDLKSGVQVARGGGEDKPTAADATPLVAGARFTASAQLVKALSPQAALDIRCYVAAKQPRAKLRRISCAQSAPSENGARDIAGSLPQDQPRGPAILWIVFAHSGQQPEIGVIERLPADQPVFQPTWEALPQFIEVRAS